MTPEQCEGCEAGVLTLPCPDCGYYVCRRHDPCRDVAQPGEAYDYVETFDADGNL